MEVIRDPQAMRRWSDARRVTGKRVGLVPTMGFLHEGHLSLVRLAREREGCDAVAVSIFVNPTQFGPKEDFAAYPRDEERDLSLLRGAGVGAAFLPPVEAMYPPGSSTRIEVGHVSEGLCGASRPGHFRGVATVVAKLFNIANPHVAVFGEKDYQQLAVIRRMARDLDFAVEVVGGATVREPDGLAMSSRNKYLVGEDRAAALCLSRGLFRARALFEGGERDPFRLAAAVREEVQGEPRASLEYAEARDPDTLATLEGASGRVTLLVAARVGPARLIDNLTLTA